jgi:hypothetical protein
VHIDIPQGLLSNNLEKVSLDLTKDSSDFLNVALKSLALCFFQIFCRFLAFGDVYAND